MLYAKNKQIMKGEKDVHTISHAPISVIKKQKVHWTMTLSPISWWKKQTQKLKQKWLLAS